MLDHNSAINLKEKLYRVNFNGCEKYKGSVSSVDVMTPTRDVAFETAI